MQKPTDDLTAVRILVDTLQSFNDEDRDRIIRWAREKLGMATQIINQKPEPQPALGVAVGSLSSESASQPKNKDIKQFILEKNPRSDIHFVSAVAYFHRFEVPADQRKEEIDSNDLLEACRKADRKRPPHPLATLNNAYKLGLLDKGGSRGKFKINSVGENLVAMALPESKILSSKVPQKTKRKKQKGAKK